MVSPEFYLDFYDFRIRGRIFPVSAKSRQVWLSDMQQNHPDSTISYVPTYVATIFEHCDDMMICGAGFSAEEAVEDLRRAINETAKSN
ncbi:MAG: hypothetical protein OXH34_01760 [Bacteroidetes bacterium]|nr:hypothetical protein [Bacteroidota bacterium]